MREASAYDDFLRPILGSVSMAAFAEGLASEAGSAEAEEAVSKATLKSAHKALATALATALAEAKAQARRDAFEAAAALREALELLCPIGADGIWLSGDDDGEPGFAVLCKSAFARARAVLAATAPAETEKPETGEATAGSVDPG